MRNDGDIRRDIETELRERQADGLTVSAAVHRGVVQLTGSVCSYCEKYSLESAVRAIAGVAEVVNAVEVRLAPHTHATDEELRCEVLRALQTEVPAISGRLDAQVRGGEVTLRGTIGSAFLRERAESAVRRLGNVATVHNAVILDAEALSREVRQRIERSLYLVRAAAGPCNVAVSASPVGGEITLSGQVGSDEARTLAEQAAWSVSGVLQVRNDLAVRDAGR